MADDPPLRGAPKCLRVASEKAGRATGRGSPVRPVSRHESRASRPTAYSPEAIQALETGRSAGGPGAISFSCSGRIAHSPGSPGFPARSPIRRVQCSVTSGVGYSERADAWELSAAQAAVVWWGEVWTLSDRETCAGNAWASVQVAESMPGRRFRRRVHGEPSAARSRSLAPSMATRPAATLRHPQPTPTTESPGAGTEVSSSRHRACATDRHAVIAYCRDRAVCLVTTATLADTHAFQIPAAGMAPAPFAPTRTVQRGTSRIARLHRLLP